MIRYVWLGDSKNGGSVLWDKKEGVAVRTDFSKTVSAKKNRVNGAGLITILVLLILIRISAKFWDIDNSGLNIASIVCFSIVFTVLILFFIKKSMYGNSEKYVETSLEDAMYAIRSTGYLKNPFIAMLVDKTLKNLTLATIIAAIIFGLLQFVPFFELIEPYVKFIPMLLIVSVIVRMIYFINFKKENKLRL